MKKIKVKHVFAVSFVVWLACYAIFLIQPKHENWFNECSWAGNVCDALTPTKVGMTIVLLGIVAFTVAVISLCVLIANSITSVLPGKSTK